MTQDEGGYDLTPPEPAPEQAGQAGEGVTEGAEGARKPRPGEPGWVPPVPVIEKADGAEEEAPDPDVEKHKGVAVAAYILFLIPLLVVPNSKFARYHANQGLLVFILWWVAVVGNVILWLMVRLVGMLFKDILVLGTFLSCVLYLLQPALLVGVLALVVYGIIHAANGQTKPLPLIGHFVLIK